MPRHTRTQRQRRLAAYAQGQRERELTRLAGVLHLLWWQYEAVNNPVDGAAGYVDPGLAPTVRHRNEGPRPSTQVPEK